MVLELQKFSGSDIDQLVSWIPDARFLLQMAGPKYNFPLDKTQLEETLALTSGDKPSFLMFKAVIASTQIAIGHLQLMNVNYERKSCIIGRVLIGDLKQRGKGFGESLVRLAVEYSFERIGMDEITLNVYDFNKSAINCYKKIGFKECESKKNASQFHDETWNSINMKLTEQGF